MCVFKHGIRSGNSLQAIGCYMVSSSWAEMQFEPVTCSGAHLAGQAAPELEEQEDEGKGDVFIERVFYQALQPVICQSPMY